MSAQAYTNRRRVLAEASVIKVQYPDRGSFTNTLSATINCLQNYQPIVYKDICGCNWNGYGKTSVPPTPPIPPPPITCISTYDGGNGFTSANIIYTGEGAFTNSDDILSGEGNIATSNFFTYDGGSGSVTTNIIYTGEGAFTNTGNILSGQGTVCNSNFITIINYDGGSSTTNSTNILSDKVY